MFRAAAVTLALAATLSGCAGVGQPAPYDSPGINGLVIPTPSADPADFVDTVDNPWFPLEPGTAHHFTLTSDEQAIGSMDTEVGDATTEIAGLVATVLTTSTTIDDDTVTVTGYYAQDRAGNVWLLGLETGTASWRAGVDGAEAGLAMPADPRLGDGWVSFAVPGATEGRATIEDQSADLVQLRTYEADDEADTEARNVYEKGVGLVGVESLAGGWTARLTD
ncbi:hypothetical protein EUA93_01800 [Nocardioides oleivorans]|uniref:Lipoprotein n=1 Tax=Nocardioides oleivorans TaxID=273676 RepID=A0A4Q2RYW1_9ACTN|nr:hypothetical protein [Nocardioides oleivorans]RYB93194.1 hypothetical protein EUA93_01800 [Nocardioides oleivorans]